MKSVAPSSLVLSSIILLMFVGCYPSREVASVDLERPSFGNASSTVVDDGKINAPARVVLSDATIILFPDGLICDGSSIKGIGERHSLTGQAFEPEELTVPLGNVASITRYGSSASEARWAASALHILGSASAMAMTFVLAAIVNRFWVTPD